jgi:hypothetical protein
MGPDARPSSQERGEVHAPDPSDVPAASAPISPLPDDPEVKALRAIAEAIVKDFPLVSEETALVLYEVDPEHLQAHWQLNPRDLEQAQGLFPTEARAVGAELRLRRIRADGTAELVAAVPCNLAAPDFAAGARFSLRNDTALYDAELGLASEDGGWVSLVRSNRSQLPPLASRWSPAEGLPTQPATGESRPGTTVPSGPAFREDQDSRAAGPPGAMPPGLADRSRPDEPAHTALREGGAAAVFEGPVEPALAAKHPDLHPVFPNPLALEGEETGPDVARKMPLHHQGSGAAEMDHVPTSEAVDDPGAWAKLPPPLLPSSAQEGQLDFPFYDPRTALSSRSIQDLPPQGEDVEVQAELLIYGRAAPGAEIDLFGHRLRVGSKGYFFLRRAVEDPDLLARFLSDLPARLPEGLVSE